MCDKNDERRCDSIEHQLGSHWWKRQVKSGKKKKSQMLVKKVKRIVNAKKYQPQKVADDG